MSSTMPSKATFVSGANRRLPTSPFADGPLERVMRLTFQLQDENAAVIPTVVTRESGATGASPRVPQQVFMVAPMASISSQTRSTPPTVPPFSHGHAIDGAAAARTHGAVPPPSPRLDVAGVSLPGFAPGYKDRNQDSALLLDTFLSNRQQLLAVFDGHGPEGHRVSAFAKCNLPYTLLTQLVEEGEAGGHGRGTGGEAGAAAAAPVVHAAAALASGCTNADGCGGGPLPRALWRAVASLDQQLEDSGIDVINSGTTAALAHVHGRNVTAAWVGDSRMLLGLPAPSLLQRASASARAGGPPQDRAATAAAMQSPPVTASAAVASEARGDGGKEGSHGNGDDGGGGGSGGGWRVVWSSTDHKPELPEEAQRIQAAGGRVARSVGREGPVGPYRVWFQDQAYPGLAMSRALGDLPGRHIGVTSTPSCASLRLPDSGPAVLVLASDGVWELLSNEQVLRTAAGAGSAAEAASRLVQQSRRAWVKEYGGSYVDDITALVMRFDMPPQRLAQRQR
ncbi:hypothetical protein PLESTB_001763700 [Pleodorina starrii]|uniref:protein-serine/threonine phosphatase n=1 Tax=Pleodorina starrii TaxID=330485 RepID=A0A9W6C0F5_9CHLO|nr:hypothetical protein PLESTM_002094700 [Pleodorina starrii]GLC61504.1 hypothetical protein PLESTB_001763700 [Pleodorina starrii]GLC77324.1 hypothetical protein PLESTF_001919700 [Pleodorina starrii]